MARSGRLGGFASGTVSGIRTRRYHALLLAATKPPSERIVLVNGFDAWVETDGGTFSLSSQLYNGDVTHPDGARRIEAFRADPWPQWIYALEDGTKIQFELFVCNGASITILAWRLLTPKGQAILSFRPFLSGRDYHSVHHENGAFQFEPGKTLGVAPLLRRSRNHRSVQWRISPSARLVPQLSL